MFGHDGWASYAALHGSPEVAAQVTNQWVSDGFSWINQSKPDVTKPYLDDLPAAEPWQKKEKS